MIEIYTDGACSGNPGPGGYGVVAIKDNKIIKQANLTYENCTNNYCELKALRYAIQYLLTLEEEGIIYCDSAYCVNIYNNWMHIWAKNGWMTSKKEPVKNLDIIQDLYEFSKLADIKVEKISGHRGIPGNELADALATNKLDKFEKLKREYNIESQFENSIDFLLKF